MWEIAAISIEEWIQTVSRATTFSKTFLPAKEVAAYKYHTTVAEFAVRDVYVPRFTNLTVERIVAHDSPDAIPITLLRFAAVRQFVANLLAGWYDPVLGPIANAEVIVMFCTGCGRRLVIDGTHRLVHLMDIDKFDAILHGTEMAGCNWPKDMPDMSVICVCDKA